MPEDSEKPKPPESTQGATPVDYKWAGVDIEAADRAVELIKEKLPVWKREIFDDDSHLWK